MKEFLQDKNGHLSSKRLGFLTTLLTAILATLTTLAILLWKEKYELAINLVDSSWMAAGVFSGVVAAEFFGKKKDDKSND